MFDLNISENKTKIIAFTSIFTTIYTVFRLIPTVPMIGVSGAAFSLSDVIAPLYGLILGPYTGGLSIILGTFLAMGLGKPVTFLGLDFLPAMINAVALGLLMKRKWVSVILLNLGLLLAFLLNPLTSLLIEIPLGNSMASFPFPWLHIVTFVVLLSPLGRKAVQWVEGEKTYNLSVGLAILAFVGTMMQHLMGALLFEGILGILTQSIPAAAYPGIWTSIFFVYPVERVILVILAVVVGTPLTKILKTSFVQKKS